jgi:hypothetical protein
MDQTIRGAGTASPNVANLSGSGSESLSRTSSRVDGVSRKLSKLSKRKSKDGSRERLQYTPAPEVLVREVSGLSSAPTEHQQRAHQSPPPLNQNTRNVEPATVNQKREKSKNRLSKGKAKEHHHPDRECIVM